MNKLILLLITFGIFLIGQSCETEQRYKQETDCTLYTNENIHKIKYDFWDTETNNKIENCLKTSFDIEIIDITDDEFIQKYPSVYGNYVIWEDYRNGKSDVYLYDIAKKEAKRITTYSGEDFKPIMRENMVLYHKQYDEPMPKNPDDHMYWRNNLWLYDIEKEDFTRLTYLHFNLITETGYGDKGTVGKGSFNGQYLVSPNNYIYYVADKIHQNPERIVTIRYHNGSFAQVKLNEVSLNHFRKRNLNPIPVGWGGIIIAKDPTPPNINQICNLNTCKDLERDDSNLDCLHREKICELDDNLIGLSRIGKYFQNGYLIGGNAIFNVKSGDYYPLDIPYKQVSGGYALEYKLRWGLENLAMINLSHIPLFYNTDVPTDVLSQFDITMDVFQICLKSRDIGWGQKECIKWREILRIYDFSKDKYYTIKGSLWDCPGTVGGKCKIKKGTFFREFWEIEREYWDGKGIFDNGIYDIHSMENFDLQGNKLVWVANTEKIINEFSDKNTDIRLAILK